MLTISVHAGNEANPVTGDSDASTAKDTRVLNPGGGATVWVAASNSAYNQVLVELDGATGVTLTALALGDGVTVTNRATARGLQVLRPKTKLVDVNSTPNDATDDVATPLLTSKAIGGERTAAEWGLFDPDGDGTDSSPGDQDDLLWIYEVAQVSLPGIPSGGTSFSASFFVTGSERTFRSEKEVNEEAGITDTVAAADTDGPDPIYFLVAGNNDEISITAAGQYNDGTDDQTFSVSNSATLKVDSRGPSITGTAPASGQTQNQIRATFQATFTDSGSGLRSDAVSRPKMSRLPLPRRHAVMMLTGTTSPHSSRWRRANGAASDIILQVSTSGDGTLVALGTDGTFPADQNKLSAATNNWRAVDGGFRFQFTDNSLLPSQQSAVVFYAFGAVDRVGNVSKKDKQRLIIDVQQPGMTSAEARRWLHQPCQR